RFLITHGCQGTPKSGWPSAVGELAVLCRSDADPRPPVRSTRSGRGGRPSRVLPARSLTAGEPGPLGLVLGQRDRLAVGLTCFVVAAEPAEPGRAGGGEPVARG